MSNEKETFLSELSSLINRHCKENESNTPDFVLAQYMNDCLNAFTRATMKRDAWWVIKNKFIENPFFHEPYNEKKI